MNALQATHPGFDRPVVPGGYTWWYIDALSSDGRHGLTLIAFVGSVFSPYYAWARAAGTADPHDHCAFNVALYGDSGRRWAMTERARSALHRSQAGLAIGPSSMSWASGALVVALDEVGAPVPRRIRGTLRIVPDAIVQRSFALDRAGSHRWWPIAPGAGIEVVLDHPRLRWQGRAYIDTNVGTEPLEHAFCGWDWSRANLPGGAAAVLYDVRHRGGGSNCLALRFGADGSVEDLPPPPAVTLHRSRWRVPRHTRADAGRSVRVLETLEDTPFYARSLLDTGIAGERVTAIHESLSLDRFRTPWVQMLLPFRMPRRAGAAAT